jgi:murein DD-endopeptidase MepM/ murein hydrolase activator NlpD
MLGAGAFGQTFDTELARTLSQSGGFGVSAFLMKALDRYAPSAGASAVSTVSQPAALTVPPVSAPNCTVPAPTPLEPVAPATADSAGGATSIDDLTRPTAKLTSGFGWRKDPLTGATSFHRGVDLKAAEGDPVGATGAGRVVFSGQTGGYGTNVVVEHANGLRTRYAHLSAALVATGDQVSEGQAIGLAGHTGRATGPHVHYEVLAGGRAVDPLR